MRQLYVELNGGRSNRRATEYEIAESNNRRAELKKLNKQIEKLTDRRKLLKKNCDHKVFFDEGGWMYDCRVCNGCGGSLGLI